MSVILNELNRCDNTAYNKRYVFGFCPVPGAEILKPLELPNKR